MAKTELTKQIEDKLLKFTTENGGFGCLEVTLGFGGNKRVDYLYMDSKDVFRCYEIKVTKSDFHSNHGHNFVGNYNYYVMPKELFDEVKNEIPKEIGCIALINNNYLECVKKPRKQELKTDINILKSSMIRSLYRETEKARMSCDMEIINRYKTKINKLEKEKSKIYREFKDLRNKLYRHFGREGWHKLQDIMEDE